MYRSAPLMHRLISDGESISLRFGLGGNDVTNLLEGWSSPEQGFRWAVGTRCSLRPLPVSSSGPIWLTLISTPAPASDRAPQFVSIHINQLFHARFRNNVAASNVRSICSIDSTRAPDWHESKDVR